jgi:hypothetical protein
MPQTIMVVVTSEKSKVSKDKTKNQKMSTFFDFCLCSTVPRLTFALLFYIPTEKLRHHFLSPPLFDTHKMEVIYADCRASRIACDGQQKKQFSDDISSQINWTTGSSAAI